MAVLVGIDEAGFGPILGPLVISSAAFSLPDDLLPPLLSSTRRRGGDLWRILSNSISDKRKHLAGRILIADSKKVYSKSLGIKHLERSVLACLRYLGKQPATLTELITMLCPHRPEALSDYPWYRNTDSHRLPCDQPDLAIAAALLAGDFDSGNVRLLELKSQILEVAYYNKMVAAVKNKANVLFSATSYLIKTAFDRFAKDNLQVIIDRQGGRSHYRRNLLLMFPDAHLTILQEDQQTSSYELKSPPASSCRRQERGQMHVHFIVRADQRFLPVSLASMVSKYIRELLMDNINRYFLNLNAGLKPTAGYWTDGLRFIEDIKKNIPAAQVDYNQLIRCR
jgi:ribonuclease HII